LKEGKLRSEAANREKAGRWGGHSNKSPGWDWPGRVKKREWVKQGKRA